MTENNQFLEKIIHDHDIHRIFIVTGEKTIKNCLKNIPINKIKIDAKYFVHNKNNTDVQEIKRGINQVKSFKPDLIIAFGGGSIIDTAKSINILALEAYPISHYLLNKKELPGNKYCILAAVPTTVGTGSEATQFSVIYLRNKKYSLSHPAMLPEYPVLDIKNVLGIDEYQVAISGFDALCQSIESYWSSAGNNKSRSYALFAMEKIYKNIQAATFKRDSRNLEIMLKAAHYSGKAINISRTTLPHALSYYLTSKYKIPHGNSVALLLAQTACSTFLRGNQNVKKRLKTVFTIFGCTGPYEFLSRWVELMSSCGLKPKLSNYGIKNGDAEKIADAVNIERMGGHPVSFSRNELVEIIQKSI